MLEQVFVIFCDHFVISIFLCPTWIPERPVMKFSSPQQLLWSQWVTTLNLYLKAWLVGWRIQTIIGCRCLSQCAPGFDFYLWSRQVFAERCYIVLRYPDIVDPILPTCCACSDSKLICWPVFSKETQILRVETSWTWSEAFSGFFDKMVSEETWLEDLGIRGQIRSARGTSMNLSRWSGSKAWRPRRRKTDLVMACHGLSFLMKKMM